MIVMNERCFDGIIVDLAGDYAGPGQERASSRMSEFLLKIYNENTS